MDIKNSTILITGGTSGIGLQLAIQLLELGSTVIITGRDQAKLDSTKKQLKFLSRIIPGIIMKQMAKMTEKSFATT